MQTDPPDETPPVSEEPAGGARRCKTTLGALGITAMSGLLPGSGYLFNRRRVLGVVVLLATAVAAVAIWAYFRHGAKDALDLAFNPAGLKRAAVLLIVAFALWVVVVATTFLLVRPLQVSRWQTWPAGALVLISCAVVAAPLALTVQDSLAQADLVTGVFENNQSATRPTDVTPKDPWGGRDRVNILLLGGDGGSDRTGTRTDSMIVASVDTKTGKIVTFSLPRNLEYARFPKSSSLAKAYPDGFTGPGDVGNWLLNAVYREVPILNPTLLKQSKNKGADAIKLAVEGSTGLRIDYYVLVELKGFQEIVDAIGGVTVNVNIPIAVGGNTELGIAPKTYLQPGPNEHLDGHDALWYARGRYGADDYQRMSRQRCVIKSIVDEANPLTLLRRYQGLAKAGKDVVRTDIPRDLLPNFVELALKSKDHPVKSVVFRPSDQFNPADPDFGYLHQAIRQALQSQRGQHRHHQPAVEQNDKKACAYDPGVGY